MKRHAMCIPAQVVSLRISSVLMSSIFKFMSHNWFILKKYTWLWITEVILFLLDWFICSDLHFESSALIYILVNGNWGTWSEYGDCSKTCNSGEKTRARQCDNPPAAHGGLDCTGSSSEKTTCKADACPGNKTKNT